MSGSILAARDPAALQRPRMLLRRGRLHRSDLAWSIAFVVPYAALVTAFLVYPIGYALWMGSDPALYAQLLSDPRYVRVAVNSVLMVGLAVTVQMSLALLLSGFFARPRRWIKALLLVYVLPWTLPAVPAYLSFHWMFVAYPQGLLDNLLTTLLGLEPVHWFRNGWTALACDTVASVWKWMPLWTLIFLGGRMAIPRDLYDAARVDGASPYRCFVHITLPLLASLYIVSALISTIWTFGDYAPVLFVSGGAPAFRSDVIATLGFHYALDFADPPLGVAAALSVLPLLVPVVLVLVRRLDAMDLQL
ncbi:MAG TPA: sugar ABC transporter permease [Xanthobacteraceae bacterium]|nr:sugar ABC transporter permease [Xanthobacteraceae bacterium]